MRCSRGWRRGWGDEEVVGQGRASDVRKRHRSEEEVVGRGRAGDVRKRRGEDRRGWRIEKATRQGSPRAARGRQHPVRERKCNKEIG